VLKPKERFSNRVDDYVRYRPGYPAQLLELLVRVASLGPGRVVADVGSGTGIFSRLLLATGARVIGIEPNADMRAAAEASAAGEPRFESRDASAEATGLPEASVDLVTAAQAFHWFEPVATGAELRRVLRPDGQVALVWNQRQDTPFNRGYEAMLEELAPDYKNVREADRAAEPRIRAFFAPSLPVFASFENHQELDEAGLRGRLQSSSYAPRPGQPLYDSIMERLTSLFRAHAEGGRVVLKYETVVWYGRL
jgi:SAM-dependent methyltransferase